MIPTKQLSRQISDEDQAQRFIETARSLGCNEDDGAFKAELKKVAKAKRPKDEKEER